MSSFPAFAELLAEPKLAALILDPAPVLVFDPEGRLRFANRAAVSAYGTASLAELIQKSETLFGEMPDTAREFAETLPLNGPYRREAIALAKNTETFRCERIGLSDGVEAVVFTGLARERSDGNLGKAFLPLIGGESTPFALFDHEGKSLAANPMAAAILGSAETLAGLNAAAAPALSDVNAKGFGEISFGVLKILLRKFDFGSRSLMLASFTQPERTSAPEAEAAPPLVSEEKREEEKAARTPAQFATPTNDNVGWQVPPAKETESAPEPSPASQSAAPEIPAADIDEVTPEEVEEFWAEVEDTKDVPTSRVSLREPPKPAPVPTKRAPSRFVWQLDEDGKFTSVSHDLAEAVGEANAARLGEDWPLLAARTGLANTNSLFLALKRRDTWSGVSVLWPVEGTETARPVDLAALPVFDRERNFLGYRGFGVFREAIPFIAKIKTTTAEETTEETAANDEFPLSHEPVEEAPAPEALVDQMPNAQPENEPPALEVQDRVIRVRPPENENRSTLSPKEQTNFREIGRVLSRETLEKERERASRELGQAMGIRGEQPREDHAPKSHDIPAQDLAEPLVRKPEEPAPLLPAAPDLSGASERALMDRLPLGIAVHRDEKLLYANRALLDWTGAESIEALAKNGGLDRIFSGATAPAENTDPTIPRTLAVQGPDREPIPVETRLFSTPWYGQSALVYVLRRANAGFDERRETVERALRSAEAATREQQAILDTATDGVLIIDRDGKITGMNKSAEALFGFDFAEIQNSSFTMLFAPESHRAAVDYLDKLASNGVASILNDGREVVGRERNGGLIPLFMNLGKVGDNNEKFCAVLRDITQWKRAEEELTGARRQAEQANSHKSDFLAKISHEMRTPLNAIIGFAEVMMEERFGPIGSDRYREYLKDIHQSGGHLISLINDLLDLSKIEAGKLELNFVSVDLNDIAKQCMSTMQPQANRERIIIRSALAEHLPPVVADERSIRQIVLNLLSNSVKFTKPGGQVILSTSLTDTGEVVLRVRDTGIGMNEEEVAAALEPFRQLATSGRNAREGTGLGLPLTKALVEANRASFHIKSAVDSGTLIEVSFPSTRVLAG
ncbi:MAG: histidine kinase dimerization/phospho-acceptor domain-containing protein [Xanthobacteraceae bacterium]